MSNLHKAVEQNSNIVVEFLLKEDKDGEIFNTKDENGLTAMELAIKLGNPQIIKLFLDYNQVQIREKKLPDLDDDLDIFDRRKANSVMIGDSSNVNRQSENHNGNAIVAGGNVFIIHGTLNVNRSGMSPIAQVEWLLKPENVQNGRQKLQPSKSKKIKDDSATRRNTLNEMQSTTSLGFWTRITRLFSSKKNEPKHELPVFHLQGLQEVEEETQNLEKMESYKTNDKQISPEIVTRESADIFNPVVNTTVEPKSNDTLIEKSDASDEKIQTSINSDEDDNVSEDMVPLANPNADMFYAAEIDDLNSIQSNIFFGRSIHAKMENGWTLLHLAALNSSFRCARYFIQAELNVNVKDNTGNTPLHIAAERGHANMIFFLVANDADIFTSLDDNWTLLHSAAFGGNIECVKYFIAAGFDINQITSFSEIPLHADAIRGHFAEVLYFSANGWSMLHCAAYGGVVNAVDFFVKEGIDINMPDSNGRTAMHLAVERGNFKLIKYLIENGADISAKQKDGKTALDVAKLNGIEKCIECLSVAEFLNKNNKEN